MRKLNKRSLMFLGVIFSVLFLVAQSWAVSLEFNPSDSTIGLNDFIDIDVDVTGLGQGQHVSDFNFDIIFDNSILGFVDYELGTELGDPVGPPLSFIFPAEDWSMGPSPFGVNLAEVSWLWDFSHQGASFTLATITFEGIGLGTSDLSFSDVILGDEWGVGYGDGIPLDLGTGSVTVTGTNPGGTAPVPEPATMILLGSGLLGLFGAGRKKFFKKA